MLWPVNLRTLTPNFDQIDNIGFLHLPHKITLHSIDKNIQIYILFKIENTYMYVRTTSVGREVIYNHLERKKKENNNNIKQKW